MRAATPKLARKSVVKVAEFEENESETKDSEQANEGVGCGSIGSHEAMAFTHDIDTSILVEKETPQDDIEVEVNRSRGSHSAQEWRMEVITHCDLI